MIYPQKKKQKNERERKKKRSATEVNFCVFTSECLSASPLMSCPRVCVCGADTPVCVQLRDNQMDCRPTQPNDTEGLFPGYGGDPCVPSTSALLGVDPGALGPVRVQEIDPTLRVCI